MMMEHHFTRLAAASLLFSLGAMLLPSLASAQRVSVQDLQAQIDALTFPYDEPAAQVRTALDILPTFQEAVVRYYRTTGEAPVDRDDAGLSPNPYDTQTSFIEQVDIYNGTIVVTFGNDADTSIQYEQIAFIPYESDDATVTWRCGYDFEPANTELLGTASGGNTASLESTTIPVSLQPSPCILQTQSGSSDDIIRAQIMEPFEVVATIQDIIEAAGIALGAPGTPQPPVDRTEAGMTNSDTDTQGRYFESVDIINGVIRVTYGNEAHSNIRQAELYWTPYETDDGNIVWRCGYADSPDGLATMGTAYGGGTVATYFAPSYDMQERYVPFECRD